MRSRGARHGLVVLLAALGALGLAGATAATCAAGAAGVAGAAGPAVPLESAVATSAGGSWVALPMGQPSGPGNTFWQLVHAGAHSAGTSPSWSVVTPPGAADNGGLAAAVSSGPDGTVLAGVLPSGLLRFSPLSLSGDGGTSWEPQFLPGGLTARPDSLAYGGTVSGVAVALLRKGDTVVSGAGLSSWKPLASAAALRRVGTACAVTTIDAVAVLPDGTPAVATGCTRAQVGLFERAQGGWRADGGALPGALAGAVTSVVQLATDGTTKAELVWAQRGRHRWLVGLWQTGSSPWTASAPLPVPAGSDVRSTSIDAQGGFSVLIGAGRALLALGSAGPAAWTRYPVPPRGTVALAPPPPTTSTSSGAWGLDAFAVHGSTLDVYALTPAGAAWTKVQTIEVPLTYGSSA